MPSNADDVAHLLRRSGFHAPAARVAQLAQLDWPAAVEAVLDTTANPADDMPAAWDTIAATGTEISAQFTGLTQWWLNRCATTPTPIVERMVHFWHGHFVVAFSKIYNVPALVSLHRLYRSAGLGKLAPITQAMAIEPAMLSYLDNNTNVKGAPNLNFARELLELFLLGVDNYTEADVLAAARAWTGHSFTTTDRSRYVFNASRHDVDPKTFFGKTANWNGPDIVTEVLTNATSRPIVARYFATKLWQFFAHQQPAAATIDKVAADFLAADLEIKAALRSIFLHPDFVSPTVKQGLVRSPIDWVVACLAATGLPAEVAHPEYTLASMGQQPFNPPNVSGWRHNGYWVNTSAYNGRSLFAAGCGAQLQTRGYWSDLASLSAADAVARAEATFGVTFSATTRAGLSSWFSTQKVSSGNASLRTNFITLVMLSPEMQVS